MRSMNRSQVRFLSAGVGAATILSAFWSSPLNRRPFPRVGRNAPHLNSFSFAAVGWCSLHASVVPHKVALLNKLLGAVKALFIWLDCHGLPPCLPGLPRPLRLRLIRLKAFLVLSGCLTSHFLSHVFDDSRHLIRADIDDLGRPLPGEVLDAQSSTTRQSASGRRPTDWNAASRSRSELPGGFVGTIEIGGGLIFPRSTI